MLKKTVVTFAFLTILTTFYGFNANFSASKDMSLDNGGERIDDSLLPVESNFKISSYDHLIRHISEKEGNDWRLMSAIAYHESRFMPDLTSRCGAKGLMQIMPSVARQFDVAKEQLSDPETNIWVANKVLTKIMTTLRFTASTSEHDKMKIVLAAYNGGIGHVTDARRLARAYGENPNSWEVVAKYLCLKSLPEYYESDVVKCGRFGGSKETLAYVDNVMGKYDKYCSIAMR